MKKFVGQVFSLILGGRGGCKSNLQAVWLVMLLSSAVEVMVPCNGCTPTCAEFMVLRCDEEKMSEFLYKHKIVP